MKNMSVKLTPEEDQYDVHGYSVNRHWVQGPNSVFTSIMSAMLTGDLRGYDAFFFMEMDAVPIKAGWLEQFEKEALEMPTQNMAIRGSKYLGHKWDAFKHLMPAHVVEHINGNAIYNLKHPWLKFLHDTFTAKGNIQMAEEMAFDVAFAMITQAAMDGREDEFAAAFSQSKGTDRTYCGDSMLIGNYANTLLNHSFDVPTYIRHGSDRNLFHSLADDQVTLGVAVYDQSTGHIMNTTRSNHPFKNVLMLQYFPGKKAVEKIASPSGEVMVTTQQATQEPHMHLCEVAKLATTPWFALTDNYHVINAPVTVLMDHSDPQMPVPVMPYVHGCERGDCQASLDQATDLFGVHLKYHHDPYELVFSTRDARDFCSSWKQAAASKSWKSCELAYGPTADDYVAWKISTNKTNLIATPKNKALYGWRAWTQRWAPAPVDMRQCRVQVYGFIEYHHALGNISSCEKRIEDKWGCKADPDCKWIPKFQSGVCVRDWSYHYKVLKKARKRHWKPRWRVKPWRRWHKGRSWAQTEGGNYDSLAQEPHPDDENVHEDPVHFMQLSKKRGPEL
ncbi:unnamed protein product [Symbiodinium natans]|uniref:Uncharacterized protein n=1 Tax=Symbiodinium natans TaxID=878477 RepID=A0A812TY49_9DINO|nr:unnamed protein product [Symbiodinium natans]